MKTLTTKSVILGSKNFGEKDKLVFLYTEQIGKIRAIAKGARSITSRFTGHLETLSINTLSLYFGPRNTILTEIISDKNPLKDLNNLEIINAALKIAEITNKNLMEEDPVDSLFPTIKNTLKELKHTKNCNLTLLAYTVKLFDLLGLFPDVKKEQSQLEDKFRRFFEYVRTRNFGEINKIRLKKSEELRIRNYLSEIQPI